MSESNPSKRGVLVRNTVVFQLKLMADGFRDLLLLPVSLIATIIGLLRGGDEPEREFNQVIEVGRESEQWINLFGSHDVADDTNAIASIDTLFTKVEETLKQQYQSGGISERVQTEIENVLRIAQEKANQKQSDQ
ncbi:MAG: hypothetical protein GY732_05960 [Gammaproteobacteria bacterium]|nr:hypothetical protein [Gammaproteobacteria bacterium]